MAKRVNRGKSEQILEFIREFCAAHGFGPTIREIGDRVGLQSTSTVAGYISRLTRKGLITYVPGTPRSIQMAGVKTQTTDCVDSTFVLRCRFRFPAGAHPMRVVAMVTNGDKKNVVPVRADCVEIVRPRKGSETACKIKSRASNEA